MNEVRTLVMVDCKDGCGVLVRPDAENGLCDCCLNLSRLLEERRVRDNITRIYAERDARRRNMGVVPFQPAHPEKQSVSMSECGDEAFNLMQTLAGCSRQRRWTMAMVGVLLMVGAGLSGLAIWGLVRVVTWLFYLI